MPGIVLRTFHKLWFFITSCFTLIPFLSLFVRFHISNSKLLQITFAKMYLLWILKSIVLLIDFLLNLSRVFGPAWLAYGHSFALENEHDQAMAAYFKASQLMKG